jgi:hypothetical protein
MAESSSEVDPEAGGLFSSSTKAFNRAEVRTTDGWESEGAGAERHERPRWTPLAKVVRRKKRSVTTK